MSEPRVIYVDDVVAIASRILGAGDYEVVRLSVDDRRALAATIMLQHELIRESGMSYPAAPARQPREAVAS